MHRLLKIIQFPTLVFNILFPKTFFPPFNVGPLNSPVGMGEEDELRNTLLEIAKDIYGLYLTRLFNPAPSTVNP